MNAGTGRIAEPTASSDNSNAPAADRQSGHLAWSRVSRYLSWIVLSAIFFSISFVRAPIPAVNEPHYLGKAKHWWDPAWCPGDFFLDSSNPHLVFYVAVGWLAKFLSLPQTACIARVVSLALLASGWLALARNLFQSAWSGVAAAAVLGLAMAWGNFSGEWLIGGVESKVFAYAFVLWGAAMWFAGRPIAAAGWLVAAVAFHCVVGMWVLIAVGMTWLWGVPGALAVRRPEVCEDGHRQPDASAGRQRQCLAFVTVVTGTLLALAPALPLIVGGDPELSREADRLLLTQRVGHHTDPVLFPTSAYWYYGGLLVVWGVCQLAGHRHSADRIVHRFIAASLVIAAVGLVVGWIPKFTTVSWQDPLRLWLLKFYPFRLADLALPAGAAIAVVSLVERCPLWSQRTQLNCSAGTIAIIATIGAVLLPAPDANPSGMTEAEYRDWIEVCDWLNANTEPTALIGAANKDWATKWFANRPEYVSFKDCPQDAAGIIEWWRRRQELVQWSHAVKADGTISAADLAHLQARTGMDYLIVTTYGPFETVPVYEYGAFKVYAVSAPPPAAIDGHDHPDQ